MSDLFLRACRGEPVERTPVWIMRQAGRYLPEYRELRAESDFWTLCRTPELAMRVTLQPVERLGVDAAILFSDIMVGFPAMGLEVEFAPGPKLDRPVRGRDDVAALRRPDPGRDLGFVLEALGSIRRELAGRAALIGFGGAPFTLAVYAVEGGGSKNFSAIKSLLHGDPECARELVSLLAEAQADFLEAQVEAGAEAIQLFDSWGGILPPDLWEEFALEPAARVIERVRAAGAVSIYFLRDGAHLLEGVARTGADVISVDEKLPLDEVAARIGPGPALQGNLDPAVLLAPPPAIERRAADVLAAAPAGRGHVFNLGHGILPGTPVEAAMHLVDTVARLSARGEEKDR
ncbi:MAG: uroporphyrinogen decarboxylase [Polyangia bacterium]